MSGHQGWLERPYQDAADSEEADRQAREAGYDNADEWLEDMALRADEARAERAKEQDLWD